MDASTTDPVALVDALEPDVIRERIADLDRQSRALRVLLRAAVARERRVRPTGAAMPASLRGGPPGGA
jgi:hypothetical protein